MTEWKYKYIREEGFIPYSQFSISQVFSGVKVNLEINFYSETSDGWVFLSSGKKRRDLSIFEAKQTKTNCGIELLLWVKQRLIEFPTNEEYTRRFGQNRHPLVIFVKASDSRRFRIYRRGLEPLGYRVTTHKEYGRVLFKKF